MQFIEAGIGVLHSLFDRWRRWLLQHPTLRRVIVAVVALTIVIAFGTALAKQWETLRLTTQRTEWHWIALACALYPLSMLVQMAVWHDIMASVGNFPSWRTNLIVYNLVNLGKSLPGVLFHIAGRLVLYESFGVGRKVTLRASILEGVLHPWVGLLCLANVLVWRLPAPWRYGVAISLIASLLVTLMLGRWQSLPLDRLTGWVVGYALTWFNGLFFLTALVRAVTSDLPSPSTLWLIWLSGSMASYLATYLLGGLSFFREVTVISLLSREIGLAPATIATTWGRLLSLISEMAWSLVLLLMLGAPIRSYLSFVTSKNVHG